MAAIARALLPVGRAYTAHFCTRLTLATSLPPSTLAASVALVSADPTVLVVRAESPYRSVKDLVDAAKANGNAHIDAVQVIAAP